MYVMFLLLLILILILVNAFFVASEFALVSIRKTRVDELVKKGDKSAIEIRKVINHIDHYISAIQLGITFASLLLGWLGEPGVSKILEGILLMTGLPPTSVLLHVVTTIISLAFITSLALVFGETVPKNIALQKPEQIARFVITPLMLFEQIFMPFIKLLTFCSMQVTYWLGFSKHTKKPSSHSEEEIKIILSQSAKTGEIEKEEAEMVYKVFLIGDLPAQKSMIALKNVVAFDVTQTLDAIVRALRHNTHSRFPVYRGSIEHVVGFIHVKDIYKAVLMERGDARLEQTGLVREIITATKSMRVDDLIIQMRRKRTHLAIVESDEGKVLGIVTLEDLLENIVGEIHDEFERPGMR